MNRLLVPIVALLTLCQTSLEAKVPRIVVLLNVEELRTDLLEELRPYLSKEGISLLLDKGEVYTRARNPLLRADRTASTALIHTGTTAISNGVASTYPPQITKEGNIVTHKSVFQDDDYIGYSTTDRRSPKNITSPTISDKLKNATRNEGLVISIAPHAEEAIIGGGQNGDIVLWIDDYNGKWVSSTYYRNGYPGYIDRYNTQPTSPARAYETTKWEPLYQRSTEEKYGSLPYCSKGTKLSAFSHTFSKGGTGIAQYKSSGLINEAMAEMTTKILESSTIGADNIPDILSIQLYAGPYLEAEEEITPELIDTYYRVDKAIASILKGVHKKVPLEEALIILTGTGQAKEYHREPKGTFFLDRCKALLNMYLMARHGRKNWVKEITEDGQIYFDRSLVERSTVSLRALQDEAAELMLDFSGVSYAVTNHSLKETPFETTQSIGLLNCLSKSVHQNRGDVLFELLPGWHIQTTEKTPKPNSQQYTYQSIDSPFIVYGGGQKGKTIEEPIDLRTISSKICHILRIRPPTPPAYSK